MESVTWNPWHGCKKISPGCLHCYVYRIDEAHGNIESSVCRKTGDFELPVKKNRQREYKIQPGTKIYTCFTSDFFIDEADAWRDRAWEIIKERSDCEFLFYTKRVDRIEKCLPEDWGDGYDNVIIGCTVENNEMAQRRLPVFLSLPIKHRIIGAEPLIENLDLSQFLNSSIESVSAGGESGDGARVCDYEWVLNLRGQCKKSGVPFFYHQTGAKLLKDGKIYNIPRNRQHEQAGKAGIDLPKTKSKYKNITAVKKKLDGSIKDFIAFDTETTGLSPNFCKIIELGAVRFRNGKPAESFRCFINPNEPLSWEIVKITGITDMMLQNAPCEKEAIEKLNVFFGDAVAGITPVIIHNAPFDLSFLDKAYARLGIKAEIAYIDTVTEARRLFPGQSNSQAKLAERFGLINEHAHRACDDAAVCGQIAIKLQSIINSHTRR